MLQLLYIIAFATLAVLAISNLIRSLLSLGVESQRSYAPRSPLDRTQGRDLRSTHPELLDERGQVINEPLLVMRSMTVEDAREQLDALYRNSPGASEEG
ncbi:MAG: DUF2973 domain-containing protein [Thermosynechococcaceae cyanobacterium]